MVSLLNYWKQVFLDITKTIYFPSRYVDVILNLIRIAGDYVSEEVWYRVIQIVINRDEVQGYAAKTVFEVNTSTINEGLSNIHEMLFILGFTSTSVPRKHGKSGWIYSWGIWKFNSGRSKILSASTVPTSSFKIPLVFSYDSCFAAINVHQIHQSLS